jgi:hypothetical protein
MNESESLVGSREAPKMMSANDTRKHLASAEAALMVIECLMAILVEQGVLTSQQIAGVVESAICAKRRMVKEHEHEEIASIASGLLSTMANSLAAVNRR